MGSPPTNLGADLGRVSAKGFKHACGHALALTKQTQQDVLSANVVVACRERHACMVIGHSPVET